MPEAQTVVRCGELMRECQGSVFAAIGNRVKWTVLTVIIVLAMASLGVVTGWTAATAEVSQGNRVRLAELGTLAESVKELRVGQREMVRALADVRERVVRIEAAVK